jgi:hypothetical protein
MFLKELMRFVGTGLEDALREEIGDLKARLDQERDARIRRADVIDIRDRWNW